MTELHVPEPSADVERALIRLGMALPVVGLVLIGVAWYGASGHGLRRRADPVPHLGVARRPRVGADRARPVPAVLGHPPDPLRRRAHGRTNSRRRRTASSRRSRASNRRSSRAVDTSRLPEQRCTPGRARPSPPRRTEGRRHGARMGPRAAGARSRRSSWTSPQRRSAPPPWPARRRRRRRPRQPGDPHRTG